MKSLIITILLPKSHRKRITGEKELENSYARDAETTKRAGIQEGISRYTKSNYAVRMYEAAGLRTVNESYEELI